MQPSELYEHAAELYLNAHTSTGSTALITLVEDEWPALASRDPNPHDAETCRLVMLATAQAQDYPAVRLWRARALARFTAIGWLEGVGTILMSEAFTELAHINSDYSNGRTLDVVRPSKAALGIMEEVERFTVEPGSGIRLGPSSPSQPFLKRLFHENRGLLQLLLGDFEAARHSYDQALVAAGDHARGRIKVRLGRLLVDYLSDPDNSRRSELATKTAELGHEAAHAQSPDVAETAATNAAAMRAGSRKISPYAIL